MRFERAAGIALVVSLLLAGCAADDDETRLRQALDSMEAALESGQIRALMEHVAADFTATRSGLDRGALELLLRRERLARESISIQRSALALEIHDGGRASVRFHALATGGIGWLPDEGRLWAVETSWRLVDDRWLLVSADLNDLLGTP